MFTNYIVNDNKVENVVEDQRTLRPSRWYRHSEVTLSGPSVSFNALVRFLRVSFRSAVSRLLRLISFYVEMKQI